jgi:hypothetical protein
LAPDHRWSHVISQAPMVTELVFVPNKMDLEALAFRRSYAVDARRQDAHPHFLSGPLRIMGSGLCVTSLGLSLWLITSRVSSR